MRVILWPFQLFFAIVFKLLTVAMILAVLAFVAGAGYFAYNYFKPTSLAASEGLALGTVEVASDSGTGTGAVIKVGAQWQVVTAAHVVGDSKMAVIIGRDGNKQRAPVVSADQEKDIAILSVIPEQGWTALPVNRNRPMLGGKVVTRCYFDDSPRDGLLVGPVDDSHLGDMHLAAIDLAGILTRPHANGILALVAVQPGCSGAPLLDQSGRIVGIVVAGGDVATIAVGAGTAIP